MSNYTFCMLENGKMPEGMRLTLQNVFPSFAGKKIRLSIAEAKEKRSQDQNSLYWASIVPHVRKARFDMGDPLSIDQVHEDLLGQFSPTIGAKKIDGSAYVRVKRSKEMTVNEMASYITAITGFMASIGYPLPVQDNFNG